MCRFLVAGIPLFVLFVHSALWSFGKLASYGEPRYLLVAAPLWGVVSGAGWERLFARVRLSHPLRWAGVAALAPALVNLAYRVVPVELPPDWVIARQAADWYRTSGKSSEFPYLICSHPG